MKYKVGDTVEVCMKKGLEWHPGVVESEDDDHYNVKLNTPTLLSTLYGIKFNRDMKAEKIQVKKHLETLGWGYLHMRLVKNKTIKPEKPK